MAEDGCEYGRATRDKLQWFMEEWNTWKVNDFKHIVEKIDKIKNSLSQRPSWAIFWIITTLTSLLLCVVGFGIGRLLK